MFQVERENMLAIVILNYLTYEKTIDCVESIIHTATVDYRIYIVDNGSSNNAYEKLSRTYQGDNRIDVISTGENLGYARGNNIAIRKALEDGCEYALISNNDILYEPDTIDTLHKKIADNNCFMVGPRIMKPDHSLQETAYTKLPGFWDYVLHDTFLGVWFKRKNFMPAKDTNVKWLHGSCFIVDIRLFHQIGLFDENTFLYYEEYIVAQKAIRSDYQLLFTPEVSVLHFHGATTKKISVFAVIENVKSEMYYLRKYARWNVFRRFLIWILRNIFIDLRLIKHREWRQLGNYIIVSTKAAFF
jgi:GT2 family glycosyltransferase